MLNAKTWLAQGILPVVVVDNPEQGLWIAQGLQEGGLTQIEITLRTPDAIAAIAAIAREFPTMRLSAGTIRYADDFARARDAGAQLFISPGFTPALAGAAAQLGVCWVPGVASASEVMMAHEAGYRVMKFFPAMAAGGPPALAAIASALGDVQFIPTGGVRVDALSAWKALPCVVGVGGTWLCSGLKLDGSAVKTLAQRAREALLAWQAERIA